MFCVLHCGVHFSGRCYGIRIVGQMLRECFSLGFEKCGGVLSDGAVANVGMPVAVFTGDQFVTSRISAIISHPQGRSGELITQKIFC